MTEIRANYYRVKGRSEMDLQYIGQNGKPYKVETLYPANKKEARRIACELGAIEWNF